MTITFKDIRVPPNMKFDSLESETVRCYHFDNSNVFMIDSPVALHVRKSGGHIVIDAQEAVHYIPPKWLFLTWYVKETALHVDF